MYLHPYTSTCVCCDGKLFSFFFQTSNFFFPDFDSSNLIQRFREFLPQHGSNIWRAAGMFLKPVVFNNGTNYQPQLVFSPDFWLPSTVSASPCISWPTFFWLCCCLSNGSCQPHERNGRSVKTSKRPTSGILGLKHLVLPHSIGNPPSEPRQLKDLECWVGAPRAVQQGTLGKSVAA